MGGGPGGEPNGFGFRTGVRSARVAFGFAVYALVLGSVLVCLGAIYFIGRGQWLWLGLMALIETAFVLAFSRLVTLARTRRSARLVRALRNAPGRRVSPAAGAGR